MHCRLSSDVWKINEESASCPPSSPRRRTHTHTHTHTHTPHRNKLVYFARVVVVLVVADCSHAVVGVFVAQHRVAALQQPRLRSLSSSHRFAPVILILVIFALSKPPRRRMPSTKVQQQQQQQQQQQEERRHEHGGGGVSGGVVIGVGCRLRR